MKHTNQISGLSLFAILSSLGKDDQVNQLLAEQYELQLKNLEQDDLWFTPGQWAKIVRSGLNLAGNIRLACSKGGEKCNQIGVLGAVEYLPWFLSTPILAIRNLNTILAGIDGLVLPDVDYLGREECSILLRTKDDTLLPQEYAEFLHGYLTCIVELWPEVIVKENSMTFRPSEKFWCVSMKWDLQNCGERRAQEELLLQPEFFYDLFEGFGRIETGDRARRIKLLEIHSQLRYIENKSFNQNPEYLHKGGELKEQLNSLTTSLLDGVIEFDGDGTIISLDRFARKILGYPGKEEFKAIYPDLQSMLGIKLEGKTCCSSYLAAKLGLESLHELKGPEGNIQKYVFTAPFSKKPGEKGGFMLIVRDRAFYSQNFVELGRTRQFLDSMLSNNPVGILIIDSRGKVIQTNPQLEEMFSLNSQLVIGNNYYNMLEDPILKVLGLDDDIRKALSGRLVERSSVDLFVESRDSSLLIQHLVRPLVVNLKMYPLTDRAGHIFNVVVSFVDITQSHLLNQHLSQLDKMQSIATLASGIAHDFNNILGAIVPNADFIEHMAEGQPNIQKKANTIKKAAKRAASLTQQLLSYSRESKAVRQKLSMHSCVTEAVNLISNAIPKSVSIFYEPCLEELTIEADPLQMQQVLINLLINASDASPKGGSITIKIMKTILDHKRTFGGNIIDPGEFVCLSVVDQGSGMEKELFEKVFNPFFTTKDKGRGTGLGLSVVHGIIKAHRGYVEIASKVGTGTRFHVHFPLSAEQ